MSFISYDILLDRLQQQLGRRTNALLDDRAPFLQRKHRLAIA